MKYYFLSLFLIISTFCKAQDTIFSISKVVKVDSVSKNELYLRAKLWVATKYNSAKNVIQLDDKENCILVIKAQFPVTASAGLMSRMEEGNVNYTFTIECKDSRYKYTIDELTHSCSVGYGSGGKLTNLVPDCGYMSLPKKGWLDIKGQGEDYIKRIGSSLEKGMNSVGATMSKDNW